MSIKIMSEVWAEAMSGEIKSKAEMLVILALADFSNDEGLSWPSIDTLTKKSLGTRRGTQLILSKLAARGRISISFNAGQNGTNLYKVFQAFERRGGGRTQFTPRGEGGELSCHSSSPEPSGTVSVMTNASHNHILGKGSGENLVDPKSLPSSDPPPPLRAAPSPRAPKNLLQETELYDSYPRKIGKPAALRAISPKLKDYGFGFLKERVLDFWVLRKAMNEPEFTPHPATFFNQERFLDWDEWVIDAKKALRKLDREIDDIGEVYPSQEDGPIGKRYRELVDLKGRLKTIFGLGGD